MNFYLLLDFAWKFLFFVTVFSTFYFLAITVLPAFFKSTSATNKLATIKLSKLSLVFSFLLVPFYLAVTDNELVLDCFGHFASKEGVFGITRLISSIWLAGFALIFIKDVVGYFITIRRLNNAVIGQKALYINELNPKQIQ